MMHTSLRNWQSCTSLCRYSHLMILIHLNCAVKVFFVSSPCELPEMTWKLNLFVIVLQGVLGDSRLPPIYMLSSWVYLHCVDNVQSFRNLCVLTWWTWVLSLHSCKQSYTVCRNCHGVLITNKDYSINWCLLQQFRPKILFWCLTLCIKHNITVECTQKYCWHLFKL